MIPEQLMEYKDKLLKPMELPIRRYDIKFRVVCDECGKEFLSCKHLLLKNGHQLCKECAWKKKRVKDLPIGTRKGRLVLVEIKDNKYVCKCDCGNLVTVSRRDFKHNEVKSCGCLQKDKARETMLEVTKHQKRENHPNWKGGITPENDRIRKSNDYKQFRQSVYERDNYTCQLCGKGSNHLVVHHLNAFNKNREQVYDENNGITLCEKCHKKYHHIFGMDTTKEQFEKYKQEIQEIGEKNL